ncbi:MAG: hypothetical protein Hyperionvirus16_52 [Hyperionvirus sp.]|uniref:Uncharacterized protein n=1 Tax=Hyperionvirus sp. TaxID=2487770 RepID=A0A3G5A9Y7_9VIRU|nr:MAG: hypothetical protein Hyperionvirus16_52 [Hyperionvirus sp.]
MLDFLMRNFVRTVCEFRDGVSYVVKQMIDRLIWNNIG